MTSRTMLIAALVLGPALAWALEPELARADAIGPPPTDCVEGSDPYTCHGPETCAIDDCVGNGDCGVGEICEVRALCVREHCCSGFACTMPGMGVRVQHVEGPCSAGGTCGDASLSCAMVGVCVRPSPIDAGGADSGAGTDSGTGTDAGGGADSGSGTDSGTAAMDSGTVTGADAGPGATTAGGCCSVLGARDPRAALLALALALAALVARRARGSRRP